MEKALEEEFYEALKKLRVHVILALLITVSVLIFYTIFFKVDFEVIYRSNTFLLILSISMCIFSLVISGVRLHVLLSAVGEKVEFIHVLWIRIASLFICDVTPFSIGDDVLRVVFLKQHNCEVEKIIGVILFELYLDVIVINVPALFLSILEVLGSNQYYVPVILCSLYSSAFWTLLLLSTKKGFIRKITRRLFGRRLSRIQFVVEELERGISIILRKKTAFISSIILSFLSLFLTSLALSLASASINMPVNIIQALETYVTSQSLGIVPIPGGAGVIEYGLTLSLSPPLVVLWRIISYYIMTLITGIALITRVAYISSKDV